MPAAARKNVTQVLAEFHKKSDFVVGPMGSVLEGVEAFSSGHFAINHIIGVNGFPIGRSVELYGPPSSGKTTCGLQCGAVMQQELKRKVLYMDYEQSMDKEYANKLGLDTDSDMFLFGQPDSFEDGMNIARKLIDTGEIGLVIWDSVAAMTPSAVIDMETGEYRPGRQAALMSQSLQQLNPALKANNCTSIFLNHIQDVFEMGGGGAKPGMPKRTTTPGGKALKFYASVRIEFKQIGAVKEERYNALLGANEEQIIAQTVTAKVVKNKVAPPFKSAMMRVYFGQGFSEVWSALQLLIGHKMIVKAPSGYYFFDKAPTLVTEDMSRRKDGTPRPFIQGEKNILAYAREHPTWGDEMVALAKGKLDVSVPEVLENEGTPEHDPEEDIDPLAPPADDPLAAMAGVS